MLDRPRNPLIASITPRLGRPLLFVDDKCCRNAALCRETQFQKAEKSITGRCKKVLAHRIRGELSKLPELLQKSQ